MMRKLNIIISLTFMSFLPFTLLAQSVKKNYSPTDWVGMMRDNTVNVHDVQKAFYTWYKTNHKTDKDKTKTGEGEEDGPYELFKRWEWYNVPRADINGNRADQYKVASDFENFLLNNSSQNNSSQSQSLAPSFSGGSWSYAGNTTVPTNSSTGNGGDGRVNRVRVFPGNNSIMYACTASGGLWKTTNGGTTWATSTDQLGDLSTSDIAINPLNTNIMYLATGDGDGIQSIYPTPATIGVLKSSDGGNTWNATGLAYTLSVAGADYYSVNELLIDPNDTAILLAATTFGIYRSTNSGATWTQTQTGWFHSMEFDPGSPSIVYAGTSTVFGGGAQFYVSTNNGVSFTRVTSGLPSSTVAEGFEIGVTDADTSAIYVLADNSSNYGFEGLYLSTNHGVSFSTKSTTPDVLGWEANGGNDGGQGWYTLSMAVSQTNVDSIWVGGVNIWVSANEGVSWKLNSNWEGTPYVHADVHHIQFISGSPKSYVVGCDGGVFTTSNSGSSWTDISNNLENGQQYCIGPSATTAGLWITGWQDNGTNLSTSTWSQVYGGDGMDCFIDWSNANTLYAETAEGAFVRSANAGATWSNIVTGITETAYAPWVTEWLQDPKTNTTLYSGFANVWKSTNSGTGWSKISTWGSTGSIIALAVDSSNNSYIYAAQSNIIEVTANGGTSWTNITGTLPVDSAAISAIAISAKNPSDVWVTFSGYASTCKVFASTNSGSTWTNISSGLPNLPVNCIVSQSGNNPNGIYVGTDQGVYYHDTNLNRWIFYNSGLPLVMIGDLKIYEPGQELLAASYGRGTWETPLYVPVTPVAAFEASPTTVCAGSTVQFTDASQNFPASWSWTFSGGTPATSTAQNPSVVYSTAGTYNVKLKVTNTAGTDSLTQTFYITVNSAPTITASSSPSSYSPGGSSTLTASGGSTYTWSPSTSLSATTGASVTANPTVTTTYTVTGTSGGCSVTNTVTITVNPTPTISASPSPASYCPGGSSTLTASGGNTYTWSPATSLSATTGGTISANPTVTTTYTVTGTNSSGCSATNTVTVTVNPTPTITASPSPASYSPGGSSTLTASGGSTYTWSPATSLSATAGGTVSANPTATTTYTVTGTNSSECSATNTVTVTVNPTPTITASPSPASYYPGGSSTLTASGGSTYTWSPSTSLSATTGGSVTANPTVTTTYTVTGTNSNGCSATNTVTVTVNPAPTITASPSPASYSPGGSSTLTASGGNTYTWSPPTSLSATTGGTVSANPTVTTTYTVTGTNSSGCSATNTVTVTVNPTPTITASPSPASYCPGGSSTLTASGGNTYTWSPSTSLSATTGGTVSANPTVTTTYTVTGTNSSGCSATNTVPVTVNPTPTITASLSPASYCNGGSSTLTASGGSTYTWSPSTSLSATTGGSVTANPTVTTTYTVTGTNSSGCSSTNTVTVTVNQNPTINVIPSPVSYCAGGSSTLTASGGNTYTWSPSTDLSATTGATVTSNPTVTTTYTVTGTDINNCVNTVAAVVTVNPLPTVTASPVAVAICAGNNTTLISAGASTYIWTPSLGLNQTIGTSVTANPTTTTTYTVTGTDSNNCVNTATSVVTVIPTVGTPSTPSGMTSLCQASSPMVYSTSATNAASYIWSISGAGASTISGTNTTGTVTWDPTFSGTATISVAASNSCGTSDSSASIGVTVNATGTWLGTLGTNWDLSGNWCGGLPTVTTDVTVPGTSFVPNEPEVKYNGAPPQGPAYCHNLIVNNDATITVDGDGLLNIYGNVVNNGTFSNASSGGITFRGNSLQTISALTVNNCLLIDTPGLVLTGNLTIYDSLTLINGVVSTGANHVIITSTAPASIVAGIVNTNYVTSWVNGNLQRYITSNTSTYDFPVGNDSYAEFLQWKNNNIAGVSNLTASFGPKPGTDAGLNLVLNGMPLNTVNNTGVWYLDPSVEPTGGSYSNIHLFWE